MQRNNALLAVCFCAGMLGALCNSTAAWLFGQLGVTELARVALAPDFTLAWLYPRLVWGGLWGLLFFALIATPRNRRGWIRKGLWLSLLPSLVQFLVIFPGHPGQGLFGLGLGTLTPLFVLLYNGIWGFFTGVFTRVLWGRP